jgi:hypothetical protein
MNRISSPTVGYLTISDDLIFANGRDHPKTGPGSVNRPAILPEIPGCSQRSSAGETVFPRSVSQANFHQRLR